MIYHIITKIEKWLHVFHDFHNAKHFFQNLTDGNIFLEKAQKGEDGWGIYKANKQERALYNIETLYNTQNSVIKLFDDCSIIASEAKYKMIYRK